ncbi:MAG: cobalamin-dependent protein [Candidatus Dormibacteria bacterium]
MRASGTTVPAMITDLFGAAQREVGRLWVVGAWNVGQEHAATAIVEQVLHVISTAGGQAPRRGRVAVMCAAGEFHALPARLAAEYLTAEGWQVDFLGVSVPNDALLAFLDGARPLALLVSCSISTNLRGAMEAFGVAHGLGIPALAGGSGFGPDASHALALGADAWAASPADVGAVLESWASNTPALNRPRIALYGEHVELRVEKDSILATVISELAVEFVSLAPAGSPAQLRLHDDLQLVVDYLLAALLVDDAAVFLDFTAWWRSSHQPTGGQAGVPDASLRILAATLPASMPLARELVRRGSETGTNSAGRTVIGS